MWAPTPEKSKSFRGGARSGGDAPRVWGWVMPISDAAVDRLSRPTAIGSAGGGASEWPLDFSRAGGGVNRRPERGAARFEILTVLRPSLSPPGNAFSMCGRVTRLAASQGCLQTKRSRPHTLYGAGCCGSGFLAIPTRLWPVRPNIEGRRASTLREKRSSRLGRPPSPITASDRHRQAQRC